MANNTLESMIPLTGKGYVAKINRNYSPGEYRRLTNVEIKDEYLVSRKPIKATQGENNVQVPMVNTYGALGTLNEHIIVASATTHAAYRFSQAPVTMWAPTSLPVDASAGSFHKIVGAFQYNKVFYWITWKYDVATSTSTIYLYRTAAVSSGLLGGITFASLTQSTVLTVAGNNQFRFGNFFIQGERVWITTTEGLYFSKATDPTIWAAPDGGSFKFQGEVPTFGFFNRSVIYVLCESGVFSISYSSSPNSDATVTQLASHIGGTTGTVHEDIPYFINNDAIYAIYSTGIQRVMSSEFDTGEQNWSHKIIGWQEYLVVVRTFRRNYDSLFTFTSRDYGNQGFVYEPQIFDLGYNVFFINVKTAAVHVVDFRDRYDCVAPATPGYICDAILNNNFFSQDSPYLYFVTNGFVSLVGSTYTYRSHVYLMPKDNDVLPWDEAVNDANVVRRINQNFDIEIESFCPDKTEYAIKKFRTVEMEGMFPFSNFGVRLMPDNVATPALDNSIPVTTSNTIIGAGGESRAPHPMRIPLNQRARSLSIRISTMNPYTPLPLGLMVSILT